MASLSAASHFGNTPLAPPDPIFHLTASYKADPNPLKINLGVGAYRDNDGNPWILPVVKKAERMIIENSSLDHEYLPIDGIRSFAEASARLILGADSPVIREKRYTAAQSISGTGAVRMGADFLARFNMSPVYISNPTWGNHRAIFNDAGFKDIREYKYWNPETRGLFIEEILKTFKEAPNGSILLLHPCAHNPTGVDPTMDQWKMIAQVAREKNHLIFFDCAYQGFASGNLDKDAQSVRYFVDQGFEMLIAQSYAKNFGLYNERTGCLSIITKDPDTAVRANSQICKLVRAGYSNPPAFGGRIVSLVLNSPEMYREWEIQLKSMADRIISMRKALFEALKALGTPGTWNHIVDQIGMFSFTGLTPSQVKILREKNHVYMTDNGRISMAGLNTGNVRRFAEAVDWAVRNVK
ncbi:hypothetical protein BATDEDRAFT_19087 [Batrachochytrium dendrobatidis JAM81]|uniref:aspartate transaminase n=1 Tax=Batrachochytrium dendrobatidis (strain JAM81 / FGSC 10211) TaxID=684364 RepID=F4NY01_BATDJ|nr:uncharacterized protein BATDEDRAFT_19087 [Batrachochytrium dendrobatidis JAM81]EGF81930.1 hypothetical protein BATDEDRAFT_19087 [Batrachochytrium dendrobatidis JAM81]|eukprot:XP_006677208.1 hypothetical protein BATDEDRAFT_19087 [Batrachochytrium dendrobatidis JAM81]